MVSQCIINFYLVGGAVRDKFFLVQAKDRDYTVTGCDSYQELESTLIQRGYKIVHRYESKFTFRAQDPRGEWADFVWARKDGEYQNGEMVSCEPGSLYDDLARRDFTINAMAEDQDGNLIDPFGGERDLQNGILRAVGEPSMRFKEDPRRLMRGLRFAIKYNLCLDYKTAACYRDATCVLPLGETLSSDGTPKYTDSVKEELDKALKINTKATLRFLSAYPMLEDVLFNPRLLNLHLQSSSKKI